MIYNYDDDKTFYKGFLSDVIKIEIYGLLWKITGFMRYQIKTFLYYGLPETILLGDILMPITSNIALY